MKSKQIITTNYRFQNRAKSLRKTALQTQINDVHIQIRFDGYDLKLGLQQLIVLEVNKAGRISFGSFKRYQGSKAVTQIISIKMIKHIVPCDFAFNSLLSKS